MMRTGVQSYGGYSESLYSYVTQGIDWLIHGVDWLSALWSGHVGAERNTGLLVK